MNNMAMVKMSPIGRVEEIEYMPSSFGIICQYFRSTPAILMANPAASKAVDGYWLTSSLKSCA